MFTSLSYFQSFQVKDVVVKDLVVCSFPHIMFKPAMLERFCLSSKELKAACWIPGRYYKRVPLAKSNICQSYWNEVAQCAEGWGSERGEEPEYTGKCLEKGLRRWTIEKGSVDMIVLSPADKTCLLVIPPSRCCGKTKEHQKVKRLNLTNNCGYHLFNVT